MLKLSMKPTGWFQIGWSAEIPPGGVKPLKYFGQDLVAFRDEAGTLAVLDAHCRHLGAHLGYGGKVEDGCVVCPYHGWTWDASGRNAKIPYQDQPTNARLRRWDALERHGIIFLWHDPAGGGPRPGWEPPDLFGDYVGRESAEADYHPCWPLATIDKPGEPIHPQLIQENAADCMHFRFAHGAPEDPIMLDFDADGARWRSHMGFRSPKTKQVALELRLINKSVGLSFAVFDGGGTHYRLVLAATPVDETTSDLRVSYFLPKAHPADETLNEQQLAFAKHTDTLFEEDARIWRHQIFIQKPVFAQQDVAAYSALRRWCEQFYEAPEGPTPLRSVA